MANFFIRNTATGSEYWDNVNKKIIHVPNGEEPSFEVESDHSNIISVDYGTAPDHTVVSEVEVNTDNTITVKDITDSNELELTGDEDVNEVLNDGELEEGTDLSFEELDKLTIPKLRDKAKELGVDVPAAIRAKGDIINLILGNE